MQRSVSLFLSPQHPPNTHTHFPTQIKACFAISIEQGAESIWNTFSLLLKTLFIGTRNFPLLIYSRADYSETQSPFRNGKRTGKPVISISRTPSCKAKATRAQSKETLSPRHETLGQGRELERNSSCMAKSIWGGGERDPSSPGVSRPSLHVPP